MKLASLFAAAAVSSLLFAAPAFAQGTAAPAKTEKSDAMAPAAKTAKARSPESLECSKQADAKGVHGKERKKFMSQCKKEAKAGEKAK